MSSLQNLAQKNKGRIFFSAAIAVATLAFIVIPGITKTIKINNEINDIQTKIIVAEEELKEARTEYRNLKDEYILQASKESEKVDTILPISAGQTEIARQLESWESEINQASGYFEIKSINFGRIEDKKDESEFLKLPVKMSIKTTKTDLETFMKKVEATGAPGNQKAERMIAIDSIDIRMNNMAVFDFDQIPDSLDADIAATAFFVPVKEKQENKK